GSYVFEHNPSATAPTAGTDNDTINPPGSPAGTLNLANLTANSFTVLLAPVAPFPATMPTSPVTYTAGSFATITLPSGVTDINTLFTFTGAFQGTPTAGMAGGVLSFTFTP